MGYRDYSTAKGLIVDSTGHGDFSTIGSAITVASSGQTIFIRPGTYTENITLKAGVNLSAFAGSDDIPTVTIVGKCSYSSAGNVSIGNIRLQTNSDFFLAITGSSASDVTLLNCFLNCANNTGISFTSSSSSSFLRITSCRGDIATTGISLFSSSSAGIVSIGYSNIRNSGASTTSSTISAGNLSYSFCGIFFPTTTSGTSSIGTISHIDFNLGPINSIALTVGGSGINTVSQSVFNTGTASCISISSTLNLVNSNLLSNTANAVAGTGTLNKALLSFSGSGSSLAGTLTVTTFPTA